MRLFFRQSDNEIAGCISDIGMPFTAADLQKPNPQQIQLVFEWFAELLISATRETVEPAMRAAAEDICGEYMDIVPADTRNLMGFYVSLRRLLDECGIRDFSFQDLLKPTHDRLQKIFSYIINFVRFRESQTGIIDEHFNKAEMTKNRIEQLYSENQGMEARFEEMKRSRKAMEGEAKEKIARNSQLKARLRELKDEQEKVTGHLERVKQEKTQLTESLEEKTAVALAVKQESMKLKPYVLSSPAALQSSLSDLSTSLLADKSTIDALDRRTRALQTSTDTFAIIHTDVISCTKLLEEVSAELQKEEEEAGKAAKHRDALSERGNNVREVERTELLLQRQLAKWNERTEKLRANAREKAEVARGRTEELRAVHRRLTEERGEKGREMERRRVRIEQTEKKMADLKENIENEIHSAHDEFLKMDSHIKLYITEMEQMI
ncbi:kinetochore-associated Ndc80 complex subunit nuf2 [Glutinoglossum americanum]|uniref:Probable kinetochore protein NUF2 n=1 Tax=Glutinoglossum americanum TaxID=1670608 RepID=A0A9P8ID28_9PEZI|nr:kinetochore-associated Ndc80 complex subunit nuf2 [Glutinoglossum americanum]